MHIESFCNEEECHIFQAECHHTKIIMAEIYLYLLLFLPTFGICIRGPFGSCDLQEGML